MSRKRTFSNKRRKSDVYLGGRKPRLTYGELETRHRTADRTHSDGGTDRDPRDVSRGPTPGVARSPGGVKEPSRRRKSQGPSPTVLAIGAFGVLALVLPLLFFIFVYPSPIKIVSPPGGGAVKTPNVLFKATVGRSFDKDKVALNVDGKDVSAQVKTAKGTITATVPLEDGLHRAVLQVGTGGLMGKRTSNWTFTVDSTPPKIKLTKKKITDVEEGRKIRIEFAGTVDRDATVSVNERALTVEKNGTFKGSEEATRVQSLKVTATDRAGNESCDYVITQKTPQAKGAHVSVFIAASDTAMGKMISLVERTELNCLQIDIKDEAGQIGFNLDNELARQIKATNDYIKIDAVVDQLRYRDIYSVARVVCFKDPKLGNGRPDLSVQSKAGGAWGKGQWLDPYSRETWEYNMATAEAAARAGFNEIQFDYVRFPSDGNVKDCVYPHQDKRQQGEVIDDFLAYARERLSPYNVFISADLFGLTASSQGDMNIGQKVGDVAQRVDFISPMVYPSHYNVGEYNIKVPEANPGDTVTKSLEDFLKKMRGTRATLRPWLQDFSLKITYTPDMVRRQIDATEALGIKQWLLWDPDCTYSEAALKPAEASSAPENKK